MMYLVFLSATPGQCQINLEKMGTSGGKYPPLIIQDGDFLYPTSQVFTSPPHLHPSSTSPLPLFFPTPILQPRSGRRPSSTSPRPAVWSSSVTAPRSELPRWWSSTQFQPNINYDPDGLALNWRLSVRPVSNFELSTAELPVYLSSRRHAGTRPRPT